MSKQPVQLQWRAVRKLHPRELIVQRAGGQLTEAIAKLRGKHDLSDGETLMLLTAEMQSIARRRIRLERHGDASKPGDGS